jgi:hypothetical protein
VFIYRHKILEHPFILHFTYIIIAKRGKNHGGFDQVMEEELAVFKGQADVPGSRAIP